jgi:hypothetical protein
VTATARTIAAVTTRKAVWRRLSDNSEVFDVAFVDGAVRFRRTEMGIMVSLGASYFLETHRKAER